VATRFPMQLSVPLSEKGCLSFRDIRGGERERQRGSASLKCLRCPGIYKWHEICITSIPMSFRVLDCLRPCRNWQNPYPSSASFNCVILPYILTQARPRSMVCDSSANFVNPFVAIITKYCPRSFRFKILFPNQLHNITLHYYVDNRKM
jgi:hypothetical protein